MLMGYPQTSLIFLIFLRFLQFDPPYWSDIWTNTILFYRKADEDKAR